MQDVALPFLIMAGLKRESYFQSAFQGLDYERSKPGFDDPMPLLQYYRDCPTPGAMQL